MGNPVVHFEITGERPSELRSFYSGLFDWQFDTNSPVAPAVSEPGNYGFTVNGDGIPGGVGGGAGYPARAMFYVGVEDVAAALADAVALGGTAVVSPQANPNGQLVIAHFTDPEGNLIGLAGPK